MRTTFAAVALFAGAAFAAETATVYDTEVYTVTSCGPEVTNCPAKHTSAPGGYWSESSAWSETIASTSTPIETISTIASTSTPIETQPTVAPYPTASVTESVGPTASAPSGTGVWSSTPSSPVPYTGAAASVKAAGLLLGAGAFAALFL